MTSPRRHELRELTEVLRADLDAANAARERALPSCRMVVRHCGGAIRAVHRLEWDRAEELIEAATSELRSAQEVLAPHPEVAYAGFLGDAEKEYAEARLTLALVGGHPLPPSGAVGVQRSSWLKGLAEAASELRRHLLDRLRAGELDRGEELLGVMDDVYDTLMTLDYPDALTAGLRRSVDALRAVLERTRGDVTTTVLQARLQQAIEAHG